MKLGKGLRLARRQTGQPQSWNDILRPRYRANCCRQAAKRLAGRIVHESRAEYRALKRLRDRAKAGASDVDIAP
jgi:hypothetical protein